MPIISLVSGLLTCLIKNGFPDTRDRVHSRVRKNEGEDFVGVCIEEGFNFAKVIEDSSPIEQGLVK